MYEMSLDKIAIREIFEPLGLKQTFFNPPENLQLKTAASEHGNRYEEKITADLYPDRVLEIVFSHRTNLGRSSR